MLNLADDNYVDAFLNTAYLFSVNLMSHFACMNCNKFLVVPPVETWLLHICPGNQGLWELNRGKAIMVSQAK